MKHSCPVPCSLLRLSGNLAWFASPWCPQSADTTFHFTPQGQTCIHSFLEEGTLPLHPQFTVLRYIY
ncbi:rCG39759 [Rattus norvegicus]|uniref:RCG39759 n=1 Tax=Rattus norvegicus TaxID=10116 RepID=A6I836_RAT|nr:rCG39759 [Rattus norvegicus]